MSFSRRERQGTLSSLCHFLYVAEARVPFQTLSLRLSPAPSPVRGFGVNEIEAAAVCQSCIEIDKQIERQRQLLHSTTDPSEVERIYRLIAQLYGDKVRLHQNPPS